MEPAGRFADADDRRAEPGAVRQLARVRHLAAGFDVERRPVEPDERVVAARRTTWWTRDDFHVGLGDVLVAREAVVTLVIDAGLGG